LKKHQTCIFTRSKCKCKWCWCYGI